MTDEQIRAGLTIDAQALLRRLRRLITVLDVYREEMEATMARIDAALQRLADSPAARSGVITSGVRLTDEEDSKALWLTRRLMPQEPKR